MIIRGGGASRTWPRLRRLLIRLVVVGLLVGSGLLVGARPAMADICSDAPAPIAPKSGLPGMMTSRPGNIPDSAPDPFADPSVPIGDVYGYNWQWANYDLGCGSDFLSDPVAVTNTQTANIVLSLTGATLAQLSTLEGLAKGLPIDWLTTVITGIAGRLSGPLLGVWLPVAVVAVGLIIGFRARRSSYADSMRSLLVIVGSVALAVLALIYPTTLSSGVDRGVVEVAKVTGQQFSASGSDAVTRESAYRTWLTGNFGDPDSAEARELGPRLMSATHYTWSDMKRMEADPNAKNQIDEDKAAEFKSVADELKTQDPAAYEMFTGRGERTGPALFGLVVVLCMSLFVGLSMLMVMIARVMMQGLALAAPLALVLGVLPTHTSVLRRLWDLFTASIVAVAKFVIAGGVMSLVLGAIQANDTMSGGAKLFWVVVATVVGLVLTRPIRSFKTIVPGLDPDRSYLRTAASGVASYFGARIGTEQGLTKAVDALPDAALTATVAPPEVRESLAALPSPSWQTTSAEQPERVWLETPAAPTVARSSVGVVGSAGPASAALPAARDDTWRRSRSWPGVIDNDRAPVTTLAALQAAPLAIEATGSSNQPFGTDDAPRLRAVRSEDAGSSVADGFVAERPRPGVPAQAGSEVVYPTGVIVADDGVPLYRRSGEAAPAETYVPAFELELDDDGRVQPLVMYRSSNLETAYAPSR